jgi:hypothetical protein
LELGRRKYQEAGDNCIMKSFIIQTLHQYCYGDEEDEMDSAGGMNGR